MSKLIIIRGYPGVGKTTFAKTLAKRSGYTFIDHNDILNNITKYTVDDDQIYREIHNLELAMAEKLLNDGKSVIVARGFGKVSDLAPYVEYAKRSGAKSNVVRLEAPVEVLRGRINAVDRLADFRPVRSATDLSIWIDHHPVEVYPDETILDATMPIEDMLVKLEI